MTKAEDYMMHCHELAGRGFGFVHPNPMVGCVIVKNGRIVGEGYHRRFGGDHAEIIALKNAGRAARGATLFVNLEPCSHQGKTPPCVEAIIAAGVRTVVASTRDPNPVVSGNGFRRLRRAGIRVVSGVLRNDARRLNEKFFTFMERRTPFIGIKIAQTMDGRIADTAGRSKWITSELARAYGHVLRSGYDAVMVGAGTIDRDDPLLTVREAEGRSPTRIILDGSFSVAANSRVVRDRTSQTIILTTVKSLRSKANKALSLERRGIQVLGLASGRRIQPRHVIRVLRGMGITSVLIEGGGTTIRTFLEHHMVDKIHCFVAPKLLGSGLSGVQLPPLPLSKAKQIDDMTVSILGDDILLEGTLK